MRTKYSLTMLIAVIAIYCVSCGDSDDTNPSPVAAFDFETSSELEYGIPTDVQFVNESQQVATETAYTWDFGDGNSSSEQNPSHTYVTGGSYNVTLTVTNADGQKNETSQEINLTSPIVGTWKLDSAAFSTIDSFATEYQIKTALEFGHKNGWSGTAWTSVGDEGYSTFWSNVIFKGSYLGRTSFFAVEYEFTADGKLIRDEKGQLPAAVYFPEERDYLETEDWQNTEGVSLNEWKSGEFEWEMVSSSQFPGKTDIIIGGSKGGFLGIYFAGSALQVPADEYMYTISLINDNQLVVTGVSNLFGNTDNLFVLKFKKA